MLPPIYTRWHHDIERVSLDEHLSCYGIACGSVGAYPRCAGSADRRFSACNARRRSELQWGSCPPIFEGDCAIAVLHGNPSKPNSDVFLRIGGGTSLPAHYHTSAERMILVSGRLLVDYQGSSPSILEPGSYAYGPPGSVHTAACLGTKACTLFIAFQGPVDALLAENVVE